MTYPMLPNCDRCGRFTLPGAPGTSWVHVPDSDVSMGDDRERCASCTAKHGPARAIGYYVRQLVEGVVPDLPQSLPQPDTRT